MRVWRGRVTSAIFDIGLSSVDGWAAPCLHVAAAKGMRTAVRVLQSEGVDAGSYRLGCGGLTPLLPKARSGQRTPEKIESAVKPAHSRGELAEHVRLVLWD